MTARRLLALGFLLAALGPVSALAAQDGGGDPPSRVGRLAAITGTVSFHTSDESQWEAATLNYPITSGNSLWTEPQSHAAVDIGSSRIYLDGSTEFDIGTLNDQGFLASLPQGAVFLRVGNDGGFEIDTPRGAVTITQPGHYEIIAGDADHPTTVSALDGAAQIAGPGLNTSIAAGQSAFLTGQNPVQASTGPLQQDSFVQYVSAAEQPYAQPGPAQQYVSPGTTGYQDLNQYGQWQQTPSYGAVWVPQVAAGWAPYRYGHWAFIAPWGWTWIDDAPWGFAPFHYGRWVDIGGGWGWAPGIIIAQPVYAPALVSFFGDFGGVGIGVSFGFGPAVGWVPLGWNEVWIPPYHCGQSYFRNVNITNVNVTKIVNINNTTIINNTYVNSYANHRGATVVPASAMVGSRSVGQAFHSLPSNGWQQKLSQVHAQGSQAPIKPSLRTAGLTPSAARQLGQPVAANGQFPDRQRAPGPSVTAASRAGAPLGNGRNLPSFATAQQKAPVAQPQGGGRFAGLSGGGNQVSAAATSGQGVPSQSFGGFAQGQSQKGQKQAKNAAPGPAIQPHGSATGTGRSFASLGNTGGSQNQGQWSFLPPLQKQSQGGANRTTGLQASTAPWSQQPQAPKANGTLGKATTQVQGQGLKSQGQKSQGQTSQGQTWASLPPLQKQPQASRSGQVGYQGGANWQPPQIIRGTGASTAPTGQSSSASAKQSWAATQPQSQQGGGQQGGGKQSGGQWAGSQQAGKQSVQPQAQQAKQAQPTQANRAWQQPSLGGFPQGNYAQANRNVLQGQSGGFAFQPQQQQQQTRQAPKQPAASQNGKSLFQNMQGGS
jgi:hypothetical protein